MLVFENDYSEGAHESILQRLIETNYEGIPGYGNDHYTESAKQKIRLACEDLEADVHFLVGGTQTNQVALDTLTTKYQGVIAAESGHISVHEAGAIEFTGHKILTLKENNGKISASQVEDYCKTFYADANYTHMVFPGAVYISHPTEYGTLYSKKELEDLHEVCKKYDMSLFLDGARLGYALSCEETDVTLPIIAKNTDAFYIGGTKVGALFGEALVFPRNNTPKHFLTSVKQHGALLAKRWLLALQFDTLFTDNLYTKIGSNAIKTANMIKKGLKEKGYEFYLDSPTNQIFVIMDNEKKEQLQKVVRMGFIQKYDDKHTVTRFCTSWASKEDDVKKLLELL